MRALEEGKLDPTDPCVQHLISIAFCAHATSPYGFRFTQVVKINHAFKMALSNSAAQATLAQGGEDFDPKDPGAVRRRFKSGDVFPGSQTDRETLAKIRSVDFALDGNIPPKQIDRLCEDALPGDVVGLSVDGTQIQECLGWIHGKSHGDIVGTDNVALDARRDSLFELFTFFFARTSHPRNDPELDLYAVERDSDRLEKALDALLVHVRLETPLMQTELDIKQAKMGRKLAKKGSRDVAAGGEGLGDAGDEEFAKAKRERRQKSMQGSIDRLYDEIDAVHPTL